MPGAGNEGPVTAFPLSFHPHLLSWPVIICGASLFPADKDRRLAIAATLGPEGLEGLFCKHCPRQLYLTSRVLLRQMPFSLLHLNHLRELDSFGHGELSCLLHGLRVESILVLELGDSGFQILLLLLWKPTRLEILIFMPLNCVKILAPLNNMRPV